MDTDANTPKPVRVQLKRTKGWRMPPNTVKVDRTTRWGNPFCVGEVRHYGPAYSGRDVTIETAEQACWMFRAHMFNLRAASELIAPLRGKNLACWCPIGSPCHADVLLELANAPDTPNA